MTDIINVTRDKIRESKHTFSAVAKHVGITFAGLSRAFKNKTLKVSTLFEILEFIEVDPIELLGENSKKLIELESEIDKLREKNNAFELMIKERNAVYRLINEDVDVLDNYKQITEICITHLANDEPYFYNEVKENPIYTVDAMKRNGLELTDEEIRNYCFKWEILTSFPEALLLIDLGLYGYADDDELTKLEIAYFRKTPETIKKKYRHLRKKIEKSWFA